MEGRDEQFENFLREFKPPNPRALPDTNVGVPSWRRLAAAAAVLIASGSAVWLVSRAARPRSLGIADGASGLQRTGAAPVPPLGLLQLTHLALTDPNRFDAALSEASRAELPDLRRSDCALQALAKE
jgi:hypothetical protein